MLIVHIGNVHHKRGDAAKFRSAVDVGLRYGKHVFERVVAARDDV